MAKNYLYKLVEDNGGAPCVMRGLLSLAICKPMIRRKAKVGDIVFGFAATSLKPDNRLLYVARITDKVSDGNYYRDRHFASRGDCIYKFKAGKFKWKSGALYHGPNDLKHDLGKHSKYARASVLLSSDFRYFGSVGTDKYKAKFPEIKRIVEQLGRGHRVRHRGALSRQLLAMQKWVWRHTRKKVLGRQTSAPSNLICHRGGRCAVV
jgi:Nucleotide modification associated domain 2